jgi:hypothetical protein
MVDGFWLAMLQDLPDLAQPPVYRSRFGTIDHILAQLGRFAPG